MTRSVVEGYDNDYTCAKKRVSIRNAAVEVHVLVADHADAADGSIESTLLTRSTGTLISFKCGLISAFAEGSL